MKTRVAQRHTIKHIVLFDREGSDIASLPSPCGTLQVYFESNFEEWAEETLNI